MRLTALLPGVLLPLSHALALHFRVPASPQLPNPATLPSTTTASLTTIGEAYTALLTADNTFDFNDVKPGSYLLDVHCGTHVFAPLRVDVPASGKIVGEQGEATVWGTFRGNEWENKGEAIGPKEGAFELRVLGGKNYYIERGGCKSFFSRGHELEDLSAHLCLSRIVADTSSTVSPFSLLKNPMILLAGVSMLLVFGMPYLMDNSTSMLHS
jgi:hypothetical protein